MGRSRFLVLDLAEALSQLVLRIAIAQYVGFPCWYEHGLVSMSVADWCMYLKQTIRGEIVAQTSSSRSTTPMIAHILTTLTVKGDVLEIGRRCFATRTLRRSLN